MHRLLCLLLLVYAAAQEDPAKNCQLRCVAKCYASGVGFSTEVMHDNDLQQPDINQCFTSCNDYGQASLCNTKECWANCKDLGPEAAPQTPSTPKIEQDNVHIRVSWSTTANAELYLVEYKYSNEVLFSEANSFVTPNTSIVDFRHPGKDICSSVDIRVAAISTEGVSPFSAERNIGKPTPVVDPKLKVVQLSYSSEPFVSDFYKSNGTINIVFNYVVDDWPLPSEDIEIQPMFHLITCSEPDLTQSVPQADFAKVQGKNEIAGEVGADMMYRKCRYVYYVQSVSSKQCGSTVEIRSPPPDSLQTLSISCDNVENSPCISPVQYEAPTCGQIEDIASRVLNKGVRSSDLDLDLTLNVTFNPIMRSGESPTLYYLAFWGTAQHYPTSEEEVFLGVNITKLTGNTANCYQFTNDGRCAHPTDNSVNVTDIHMNILYGITFCAVKDPRNLTIPNLLDDSRSRKPKANQIYVDSDTYKKSLTGVIVGCTVGGVALLIVLAFIICCYVHRKQKMKNEKFRLKITQLQREKENRYIDLPKKHDIWEIERRNLIIHNDKKLGSGAFGAVYLGKLLGKSLGHKDANSPLGVNLMRAENCEVAVKMLPEYADELSKSDFLREIGLMKTIGYHERLVNMLACVTDSEPLCLVVEYCNDGDLLNFLRDRCKYMMKLDELGIDYHQPPVDENYDLDMLLSLKQLLQFAVQISVGLEYLSQKGFVHRDVAARNILVDNNNSCKIGDFGLCRYIYAGSSLYKSKGGRLPVKWMSPEALRNYQFSTQSDVWSFGILLFEIITLGGSPYPGIQPEDMLTYLESGGRMEQPDNCPNEYYTVMRNCWHTDPEKRPEFGIIRQQLASQLEEITEEYSYLRLDAQRDYYNVNYGEQKNDVITIPESDTVTSIVEHSPSLSIESLPIDDLPKHEKSLDSADDHEAITIEHVKAMVNV